MDEWKKHLSKKGDKLVAQSNGFLMGVYQENGHEYLAHIEAHGTEEDRWLQLVLYDGLEDYVKRKSRTITIREEKDLANFSYITKRFM